MFTMFPAGIPGVGLIILRLCSIGASVVCVLASDGSWSEWPFLLLVPLIFLLMIGLLTPFSCLALLGLHGVLAYRFDVFGLWHCWLSLLLTIAVLCLGPGAYSCDAVLFGRHRLTIRRPPPDTKPHA
jgi:hypothetical protein